MRVVTKLYLTFSLILLLLFFSSGFAYLNTGKVETQTTAIIATSAQLTSEAARLRQGLFRIQQILQAYRLDGDQAQDTRAPEQARAVLARMQAVLAPATALGHFLGESVRAQMLQQVGALQTLSAEVFALQAVNWQQQAAVTAQRQQLENSLMVVHSTFERLGNTLLSGDSFLQKTANAYQANLQQANNLVARAMFMTDIRALSTQQDLLANMQADIEDGFAELQDNLPALKAETDLLAAQQIAPTDRELTALHQSFSQSSHLLSACATMDEVGSNRLRSVTRPCLRRWIAWSNRCSAGTWIPAT